ncbi:MAG: terminase small subunit [Clostridia bacterium]|nr:terminase small subunit [Clostridia bacterium]
MNTRQKAAADYYLETGDGYTALIKAGYSKGYAKNYITFFKKQSIQKYLSKILESEKTNKDTPLLNEIVDYLTGVMRGEDDSSSSQRMKAAELLYKLHGLNKENSAEANDSPVVICDNI